MRAGLLQLHRECLFYKLPRKTAFSAVPPGASGQEEAGTTQTGTTDNISPNHQGPSASTRLGPPGSHQLQRGKRLQPLRSPEGPLTHGGLGAAEEGRVWAGLTIGPQISAEGTPGAGFGGPAPCDKLLRRLTPRHVPVCAHRHPRVLPHTTAVVSGEGPVHWNPALDSVRCLDAVFQHTEGKEGLRRGARAGGGEGLTPCSLSLAHLEVPIRSASPGPRPEVSGRAEPSSLGHTPRSWAAVGPFSLPGGPVRGQGGRTLAAWPPSAGETPHLGAQEPPGVQGPPDGLPLTVDWGPRAGGSLVTEPQTGSPGAR